MSPGAEASADDEGPTDGSGSRDADELHKLSHGAGVSAAAAGLFLLLRILAVSDWDWHTAAAVSKNVQLSDAVSIVLGTLFAEPLLTGIMVTFLLPMGLIRLFWPSDSKEFSRLEFALFAAVMITIAAALIHSAKEWWLPLSIAGIAIPAFVIRMVRRRQESHHEHLEMLPRLLQSLGTVAIAVVLVLAATVTTPWVPRELITTKQGPVVGYVMRTDSGYLKVLTAHGHEMKIIISSNVISRRALPS